VESKREMDIMAALDEMRQGVTRDNVSVHV